MSSPNQALLFARNFLRYPKVLGSVVPSSPFLVDEVLRHVDWDAVRVIVEYGPGVGTITGEVLRRMGPDARLIAIELNTDFVEFLTAKYRDPRLRVVRGSALDVDAVLAGQGFTHADVVVSGIPFSTMDAALRKEILGKTASALGPAGRFLVYQFTRALLPHLRQHFRHVREEFVPLNILPARVYDCRK